MRLRLSSWLDCARVQVSARLQGPGRKALIRIGGRVRTWLIACCQQGKNFLIRHPRLGGGIIMAVMLLLGAASWYAWSLKPPQGKTARQITVTIPYGASLRQVGRDLQAKGLIRNELSFELFVRLGQPGLILKAGRYRFSPAMPLGAIVDRLSSGAMAVNRVTLPEGLTVREMAETLEKRGLIRKDHFFAVLQNSQWIKNRFKDYDTGSWPEGYLFPDTYQFQVGASEEEIIVTMLKRFDAVFSSHFPRLPAEQRRKIVIIASLVEKEAKRPEERAIIAGVFYNRLRRDYPLQSCATVEYALGTHKPRLTYEDIKIDSPYNTYEHYGLPPGPIANPGLASLKAAVNPAKVDYLYFVAKQDGGHVFSETYEQHLRAQRRINRFNKL